MFIMTLFIVAMIWKQPKCLFMGKEDMINTHTQTHKYYPATKKNEILPSVTTWMNLDSFMLSEIRLRRTNTL